MITHKKDSLLLFAEGEYSDYRTGPMIRAVMDLDIVALGLEFKALCPPRDTSCFSNGPEADSSSFTKWLVEKGVACEVEYSEVHLGSYGEFDFEEMIRSLNERARTTH